MLLVPHAYEFEDNCRWTERWQSSLYSRTSQYPGTFLTLRSLPKETTGLDHPLLVTERWSKYDRSNDADHLWDRDDDQQEDVLVRIPQETYSRFLQYIQGSV